MHSVDLSVLKPWAGSPICGEGAYSSFHSLD
jgi:hypothetical protein